MKKNKTKSIKDLLIEYFKAHPKEDMSHGPVVDWVEAKYKRLYNKKPRDTWRSIRNLHEVGFLIKVKKGIYRYDPEAVKERDLEDFTPEQKRQIFERDNYRCVQCGRREDKKKDTNYTQIIEFPKIKAEKQRSITGKLFVQFAIFERKIMGKQKAERKCLFVFGSRQ